MPQSDYSEFEQAPADYSEFESAAPVTAAKPAPSKLDTAIEAANDALPFTRDLDAAVMAGAPQIVSEFSTAMAGGTPSWQRVLEAYRERKDAGVARSAAARKENPWTYTGVNIPTAIGGALAMGGLGAGAAATPAASIAPQARALYQTGVNAAVDTGSALGTLENYGSADLGDAITATTAGRALGAGIENVGAAYRKAKDWAGSEPARRGLDKLYAMLGGKSSPASEFDQVMAKAAPEDEATRILSPWQRLHQDEFGGNPPSKDPDFLQKSGELADMLGQSPAPKATPKRDPAKFKSKGEAFDRIVNESIGDYDPQYHSRDAGHFDEIERIVGRKVKDARDAFNALVAESAKKRGKGTTRDWEDVQTAIRELKKLEGFEKLRMPDDAQEALLSKADDVSFDFGANVKPKPPKSPEIEALKRLRKRGEAPSDTNVRHEIVDKDQRKLDWAERMDRGDVSKVMRASPRSDESKLRAFDELQAGVDDAFPEPIAAEEFAAAPKSTEAVTNPRGGAGSSYQPMGAGIEDMAAKRERIFREAQAMAAKNNPDFAARGMDEPVSDSAMASAETALDNLRRRGLVENVETDPLSGNRVHTEIADINAEIARNRGGATKALGPQMPGTQIAPSQSADTVVGGPALRQAQAPQQAAAGPARDAERIARGRERMKLLGQLGGGINGAMAGAQFGGLGTVAGGYAGAKVGGRLPATLEKGATSLDELGKKINTWLTDPDKLVQLEAQGGQLGKAATFVIGNDPAGIAARAFIVSQAPWFRDMFSEDDQKASGF